MRDEGVRGISEMSCCRSDGVIFESNVVNSRATSTTIETRKTLILLINPLKSGLSASSAFPTTIKTRKNLIILINTDTP